MRYLGYSTYSPNNTSTPVKGEFYYENEKWYYAYINYWWDGISSIGTTDNCKYIEGATTYQDAAEKLVNDFFNIDK